MNLINSIREWLIKMLTRSEIRREYGNSIAISTKMQNIIQEWCNMYNGNASWVDADLGIPSLRIEQAITREFVNTIINEMSIKITNDKLNDIFEKVTNKLNINLQRGLATGAMVIKPLGGDKVQFVSQDAFVPLEYDVNGRLIKVVFPEVKQISETTWLTRLEMHSIDSAKGLTITNRAYTSNSPNTLGHEIPLSSVDEWSSLIPEVTYPTMTRPAFGYFCCPIDNTVDSTHAGISIFHSALQLIKKADIQASRIEWEFESGERAIIVDEVALMGTQQELPKLNKRLYKGLNIDGGASGDFFQAFSPTLRQADYIAGLEEYKREIEFAVGLSYGDLSNPQSVEKTATEIKTSKQRKYDTVMALQEQLRVCLDDLCYAIAFYNGLVTSNYEMIIDFEDSILSDDDTKRNQDRQDVSMGIMPLWEYRMKWYSEDEKTAKSMIEQQPNVIE